MKVRTVLSAAVLALLTAVAYTQGAEKKSKPGPLTGTWECTAHGGPQGDVPFTLTLEQAGEQVTGSVESPMGGTELTTATFKNKRLEIHIDTSEGNYVLTGLLKKGKLAGDWKHDPDKGTWEGSKQAPAAVH